MNLNNKRVLVVGCGGLGGFVIDELARLNVGKLILFDGDKFDESNLNRQLLSSKETIGSYKAESYAKWVDSISNTKVEYYNKFFDEKDSILLDDVDLIIDCVDRIKTRIMLANECEKHNKIMIHGAIEEDQGQVMVCMPGDKSIEKLFSNKEETVHKTNSYSVATVASLQAAIAHKVLLGEQDNYRGKILIVDLDEPYVKLMKL